MINERVKIIKIKQIEMARKGQSDRKDKRFEEQKIDKSAFFTVFQGVGKKGSKTVF